MSTVLTKIIDINNNSQDKINNIDINLNNAVNRINNLDSDINDISKDINDINEYISNKIVVENSFSNINEFNNYLINLDLNEYKFYTFINNSNIDLTKQQIINIENNDKKNISAILEKTTDCIRIYYINQITYIGKISNNSITWEYVISSNINNGYDLNSGGQLLVKNNNNIYVSNIHTNELLRNDVIRGVIEIFDINKNDLNDYINTNYKDYYYDDVDAPSYTDNNIKYIQFNPLSLYTKYSLSGPLQTGLYIIVNNSKLSYIKSEGDNLFKGIYGFCSIVNSPNSSIYKQYIYMLNDSIYFRNVTSGYTWPQFEKINLKNPIYEILWDELSNMNNYLDDGIYICNNGMRTNSGDNLPMTNITKNGNKANFGFILYVTKSLYTNKQNITYKIIGQTLILSNRIGGETKIYTRSFNFKTDSINEWTSWKEHKNVYNLNKISSDGLNSIIDNGEYEGVVNNNENDYLTIIGNINTFKNALNNSGSQILPTGSLFTMKILNNYMIIANGGDLTSTINRSISQKCELLLITGEYYEIYRTKPLDGNWGNWKLLNK